MIASIAFRNFKALRGTRLALAPFNLVIGPSGSGKTSLIEAILRLQALSRLPTGPGPAQPDRNRAQISFEFHPPFAGLSAHLGCSSAFVCDLLEIRPPGAPPWNELKAGIQHLRAFLLDHRAMGAPAARATGPTLSPDGANLAAVLAALRDRAPAAFAELERELVRLLPEFRSIELRDIPGDQVELALVLQGQPAGGRIRASELAQGTLFTLAMLALAYDPAPPPLICFEEIDRGIHPRQLRAVRDLFYRLSYPESVGLKRPPVQVIATTHSPLMVDLFRDHPEEIVISQKRGTEAHFERLADRPDVTELLREGSLGDIWISGILGGVPEEPGET